MSNKEKSLKSQYSFKLWSFIAFNFLLFWFFLVSKEINFKELIEYENFFNTKNIFVATLAPIITIVLNGLLSHHLKAVLVFWKFKYPLPGSRVFTILVKKDLRVDIKKISKKYGKLPIDPEEQNKLWYKIYKANESKISVEDSHKNYLFCRDMTALSFIFLLVFTIILTITYKSFSIIYVYVLFLLFQFIILALVSKNYGNRFVCNVLAEDSSVI